MIDLREQTAWLALGFSLENVVDEKMIRVAENLSSFLKYFAQDWLGNARGYNSTKHGLTAISTHSEFTVNLPEEDELKLGFGDSLTFLDFDRGEAGELKVAWVCDRMSARDENNA